MLLYLDCCCFNRPFYDLSQIRVRLEAEAVEWILEEFRTGRFTIVTRDYLIQELLSNPKPDHRASTLAMTQYASLHVPVMDSIASRASQIESLGITGFDALHIAAAESAECDHLVTTDDRLQNKSQRHQEPADGITPQSNRHHFTAMTLTAELNQQAKAILFRELGPVDYARFFQQYEEGCGNYTDDRHQWLGEEDAQTLHEQATQLAAKGELPRLIGAKLHGSEG